MTYQILTGAILTGAIVSIKFWCFLHADIMEDFNRGAKKHKLQFVLTYASESGLSTIGCGLCKLKELDASFRFFSANMMDCTYDDSLGDLCGATLVPLHECRIVDWLKPVKPRTQNHSDTLIQVSCV